MNTDEKELEKAYDLFYDYMIKCYGYCDRSYDEFKEFVVNVSKKEKTTREVNKDENSTN